MMRVGVIGCGKKGYKHIQALKKISVERILALDIRPDLARELAGSLQVESCECIHDLMRVVDVVDICTPAPSHFTYSRMALSSGKHVVCEKPLTVYPHEVEELQALAGSKQRLGMVAFVYKYHPCFVLAKKAIDTDLIGPLRAVYMRFGGKGSHRAWNHQAECGGGILNEMLSHMLDLLLWFVGDIVDVELAHLDNIIKRRIIDGVHMDSRVDDFALIAGRCECGAKFVIQSDLVSQDYSNQIEVIGEDGHLNLSLLESQESYIHLNRAKPPFVEGKNLLKSEPTDLFKLMFEDFFDSIRYNRDLPKNSFQDAHKLAQLFSRIGTHERREDPTARNVLPELISTNDKVSEEMGIIMHRKNNADLIHAHKG